MEVLGSWVSGTLGDGAQGPEATKGTVASSTDLRSQGVKGPEP